MAIDPVCGMYVSEDTDLYLDKDGTRYYFCSTGCLEKFREPEREEKSLKIRLIVAWSFSIPILILNYALVSPYRNYILLLLALPVQFYSGLGFYHGAYGAIKNRSGNMDLLITLGTLTAFIFHYSLHLMVMFFQLNTHIMMHQFYYHIDTNRWLYRKPDKEGSKLICPQAFGINTRKCPYV